MNQTRIYLNREWEFTGSGGVAIVDIPHTFVETGYNCFDESCYQMEGCYRKSFLAEPAWAGKEVLLTVDGAAHYAEVYCNGQKAASHGNGYTAFTVNLSPYLNFEGENLLEIKVDSRETLNIPPFGKVIDYMTYGGIYRDIYLTVKEKEYIADLFVRTNHVRGSCVQISVQAALKGCQDRNAAVRLFLYKALENVDAECFCERESCGKLVRELELSSTDQPPAAEQTTPATILCQKFDLWDIIPWDTEHPQLYFIKAVLYVDDMEKDTFILRTGFRMTHFTSRYPGDGFYLNGQKVKLRGLNRHQSFPYFGYAMPRRVQRRDADILKKELGLNAVRTSHYPQSHAFLDRCDELGLLVFTELPGWQYIGDQEWKEQACQNVKEMVSQYRNHPSIFLWGVRINESVDDDAFYEKTNEIAHKLDGTRATGGVRFLQKSHLLEDVYTYNDFLHNGTNKGADRKKKVTSDMSKAYLVSEYNGHMYPTKSFDPERCRTEHALRHARVLNEIYKQEDIAGGFGWCMADYNTHKDFGSGDRICYHGVLDMFRNPKTAAAVYASQQDDSLVFEISSSMDIGEHPAGNIGDVYAFTNADSVKLYKNGAFVKEFFPYRKQFGYLPHPPVKIDDFIGGLMEKQEGYSHKKAEKIKEVLLAIQKYGQNSLPPKYMAKMLLLMATEHMTIADGYRLYSKYAANWGDEVTAYRFEAVRGGKTMAAIEKKPFSSIHLEIDVDTTKLTENETYDVASLRFRMKDENGNLLPFYQEPVTLKAEGAISLMGPEIISLKGGMGGAFVRTKGESGMGALTVTAEGMEQKIEFEVN
ncbi:MAG: glycoside hydrolase family 2 protein [Blautia sp.]|nr:glycoside hydrolase family 2 protein [Blautia sp.]